MRNTRRRSIWGLALVMAVTAASCNLPMATAGAKCSKVGAFAQDGTYVMKCGSNHRWVRGITVQQGDALVAAINASRTTTTTTTTTPPDTTGDGIYAVGAVTPLGWYRASGGSACTWSIYTTAGAVRDTNTSSGPQLFELIAGDAGFSTRGCSSWTHLNAEPAVFLTMNNPNGSTCLSQRRATWSGPGTTGQFEGGVGSNDGGENSRIWVAFVGTSLAPGVFPFVSGLTAVPTGAVHLNLQTDGSAAHNDATGFVTVTSVDLGPNGFPNHIDATFVAQCGGPSQPVVLGRIKT